MKARYFYLSIIILFYILLPTSILVGLLDFNHKFVYLTVGSILIYLLMRVAGNQNSEMGLSFNSSAKSMKDVTVLTVILGILGVFLYLTGIGGRFSPNETVSFYLFYIFISSPAQEFLYRGALVRILTRLNASERSKMIVSSALYSFVHIIYKDFWTLILTFCIGIIWYRCYRKTNNLLGVCVSHAVLGIVTILAGVID